MKGFNIEWEVLITLSKETKPAVTLISKNKTPLKWIESFKDFLFRTYVLCHFPLLCVVREDDAVPNKSGDPLVAVYSYGASVSVLDEMISRLEHTDILYKSDNAMVYSIIEEATLGSIYAKTIKPYAQSKDGRSTWESMVYSHSVQDKWEELHKKMSKFLMNTKWNGRTFRLEKFTGLHLSSFVQFQEAAEHIAFHLTTEHTRVGYLLDCVCPSSDIFRHRPLNLISPMQIINLRKIPINNLIISFYILINTHSTCFTTFITIVIT